MGRANGLAVLAAALLLAGCGGDSGTSGSATVTSITPSPAPTIASSTPASVAALTTLDFDHVANYASPLLPAYYDATVTALDNVPAGNPQNDKLATLGRVLFYDKQLSINAKISCASCHQQALGFSDGQRFSTGFSGSAFTSAHAPGLGNVRYWQPGTMFWDRRAASLELQASAPITNPVEMGWDSSAGGIAALIARLQALPYYQDLFTWAFGSATITEAKMQQALANFERAMISSNSRWDQGYALNFDPAQPGRGVNQPIASFTAQEDRGRQLFMGGRAGGGAGCAACHQPPTFALAANSRSNGLDAGATTVFKSPSLKNIGLRTQFMHDGRFSTLAEVVEFYSTGIQAGPSLDGRLKNPDGSPALLNLSTADKAALVAFLLTLSDNSFITDPRFSSPFR